jgi:HEAT repeat protein
MRESSLESLLWQAMELYQPNLLEQFLHDPSKKVRIAAARRIQLNAGRLGFDIALKMINSNLVRERETAAFLLGQLKKITANQRQRSMEVLCQKLDSDKAAPVRAAAAASLGHLEIESAIESLCRAANDSSELVRANTAAALARFPKSKRAKAVLDELRQDASPEVKFWASD